MEIRVCNLLKLERDGRENCLTLKGLSAFIFAKIKKKKRAVLCIVFVIGISQTKAFMWLILHGHIIPDDQWFVSANCATKQHLHGGSQFQGIYIFDESVVAIGLQNWAFFRSSYILILSFLLLLSVYLRSKISG